MEIDSKQKIDILLTALGERYTSLHAIRARVESIGTWAIGLSLGSGGWLLQSKAMLSCVQKTTLTVGVLSAFAVLRFLYLADLHRGFRSQQQVAVKIEAALELFTPGAFEETASIYPENWKLAGKNNASGKFFRSTYALLYVAAAFLISAILAAGMIA
jgi:hypothetical protein